MPLLIFLEPFFKSAIDSCLSLSDLSTVKSIVLRNNISN